MSVVSDELRNITDDRFRVGNTDEPQSLGKSAAQVAKEAASTQYRVHENDTYQTQKRIENTTAVMSLVLGNYDQKRTAQDFASIDMNNKDTKDFMSAIGLGNTAQDSFKEALGGTNFVIDDGKVLPNASFSSFKQQDISDSLAEGSFVAGERAFAIDDQSKESITKFVNQSGLAEFYNKESTVSLDWGVSEAAMTYENALAQGMTAKQIESTYGLVLDSNQCVHQVSYVQTSEVDKLKSITEEYAAQVAKSASTFIPVYNVETNSFSIPDAQSVRDFGTQFGAHNEGLTGAPKVAEVFASENGGSVVKMDMGTSLNDMLPSMRDNFAKSADIDTISKYFGDTLASSKVVSNLADYGAFEMGVRGVTGTANEVFYGDIVHSSISLGSREATKLERAGKLEFSENALLYQKCANAGMSAAEIREQHSLVMTSDGLIHGIEMQTVKIGDTSKVVEVLKHADKKDMLPAVAENKDFRNDVRDLSSRYVTQLREHSAFTYDASTGGALEKKANALKTGEFKAVAGATMHTTANISITSGVLSAKHNDSLRKIVESGGSGTVYNANSGALSKLNAQYADNFKKANDRVMDSMRSVSFRQSSVITGKGLNGLTETEINQLRTSGSFTRDGVKFTAKISDVQNLESKFLGASVEANSRKAMFGARSRDDKIRAMSTIQSSAIAYFASKGGAYEHINAGNMRDVLSRQSRQLEADIASMTDRLTHLKKGTQEFDDLKDKLDASKKELTEVKEGLKISGKTARAGLSAAQRRGLRLAANYGLGHDVVSGYQTYKHGAKIIRSAVSSTYRFTLRTGAAMTGNGGHISQAVGKLLDKSVPGQKIRSAGGALARRNEYLRGREAARRSGTLREYDKKHRTEVASRRAARLQGRIAQDNETINRLSGAKGERTLTKKEERQLNKAAERNKNRNKRADRKKSRQDRLVAIKNSRFGRGVNRAGKGLGRLGKAVNNVLSAPRRAINFVIKKVKASLVKLLVKPALKILSIAVVPICLIVIIGAVASLVQYSLHFISDINLETHLADGLNAPEVSYCQIIADSTAQDLCGPMLDTLAKDARNHFLDESNKVATGNDLAWYCDVNDGSIENFYAIEDDAVLDGPNANLVPIMSMMHTRYLDMLDFESWQTARGYTYYMYAQTHHIKGYKADREADCTDLYNSGYAPYMEAVKNSKDEVTGYVAHRSTTGDAEKCTNIYVHGYKSGLNKELNDVRASANSVVSILQNLYGVDLFDTNSANGVFKNEIPHDSLGECNNYQTTVVLKCTKESHRHSIKPSDSAFNPEAGANFYEGYTGGQVDAEKFYKAHHSGDYSDAIGCWHVHKWVEHEEGWDQYRNYEHWERDTDHYDWELCCGKEEHSHTMDQGCYDTYYMCKGHCGGHVTPKVDVYEDMSYPYIAQYDAFKTTRLLVNDDFEPGFIDNLKGYKSLAEWNEYWVRKAKGWFKPIPSDPSAFFAFIGKTYLVETAKSIDSVTGFVNGLIHGGNETAQAADDAEGEDYYGFEGWTEEVLEELETYYGSYAGDKYALGIESWKEFDDIGVTFPIGTGHVMSEAEIQGYINTLKANYPGLELQPKRLAVIEAAMRRCGMFYYDLTGRGHENGRTGISGPSECSGFVSGTLRAAGINYNGSTEWSGWSAATFAGHANSSFRYPGDILAHSNGGTGSNGQSYTGHVVIYIGRCQADGKEYIIDCTSSNNAGSSMRLVNVNNYPKIFSPY